MKVLKFEEAMALTVNRKHYLQSENLRRDFSGYIPSTFFYILSFLDVIRSYRFQVHIITVFMLSTLATYPLTVGLPFMEKAPKAYTCEQLSSNKMSNQMMDHKISWKQCTQDEICAESLEKSQYRAD